MSKVWASEEFGSIFVSKIFYCKIKTQTMEPNGPGSSTTSRATRFMMEGVGARVIRGPDWKWGKQVDNVVVLFILFYYSTVFDAATSCC